MSKMMTSTTEVNTDALDNLNDETWGMLSEAEMAEVQAACDKAKADSGLASPMALCDVVEAAYREALEAIRARWDAALRSTVDSHLATLSPERRRVYNAAMGISTPDDFPPIDPFTDSMESAKGAEFSGMLEGYKSALMLPPVCGGADVAADVLTIAGKTYAIQSTDSALPCVRLISDKGKVYDVTLHVTGLECDCPDYTIRRKGLDSRGCKHTRAVHDAGLLDGVSFAPPVFDVDPFVPSIEDRSHHAASQAERERIRPNYRGHYIVCKPERLGWEIESHERSQAGSQLGHH